MLIGAVLRYPAVLEIATSHGFYAMLLAMTWKLGGWLQRFNRTINCNLKRGGAAVRPGCNTLNITLLNFS